MINNAAISSGTALLETTDAQWEQVMRVNLTGMFYGCKRAVQQMISQEPRDEARGRIINLGSQQGIVTCPGETPYGVSKAGAIYITRQIACDYAAATDHLQQHFARKNPDRPAGCRPGSRAAGECPQTDTVAATG